jgi:nucleotide-binding universal stress UspA family protein
MKVLISLGSGDETLSVASLLGRMKISPWDGALLRVLERVSAPLFGSHPALTEDVIERFLKMQELAELEKLASAQDLFARHGLKVSKELKQGLSPANEILEASERENVDLVVTGWRQMSSARKILGGSVNRKLVSQTKRSLLVVRNVPEDKTGPIHAVLATDHSPYMDRCLDELLKLAPKGLGKVTILTSYPRGYFEQVMKFQESFHGDVAAWVEAQLQSQNQKIMEKLAPLGCEFASIVSSQAPESAIADTMASIGAELLIVGSQGHGFFERLTVGSLSYDLVMNGNSSVLVLRAAAH